MQHFHAFSNESAICISCMKANLPANIACYKIKGKQQNKTNHQQIAADDIETIAPMEIHMHTENFHLDPISPRAYIIIEDKRLLKEGHN